MIVTAAVLPLAVGITLVVAGPKAGFLSGPGEELPFPVQVVGYVLAFGGLIAALVGFIRQARRGGLKPAWRSPLIHIDAPQRKQLLQRIRRGAEVEVPQLPLAHYLADTAVRQGLSILPMLGIATALVGQGLLGDATWLRWMALALLVLETPLLLYMQRDAQRARRWIANHPQPELDR